jgi:hypothetical protein
MVPHPSGRLPCSGVTVNDQALLARPDQPGANLLRVGKVPLTRIVRLDVLAGLTCAGLLLR